MSKKYKQNSAFLAGQDRVATSPPGSFGTRQMSDITVVVRRPSQATDERISLPAHARSKDLAHMIASDSASEDTTLRLVSAGRVLSPDDALTDNQVIFAVGGAKPKAVEEKVEETNEQPVEQQPHVQPEPRVFVNINGREVPAEDLNMNPEQLAQLRQFAQRQHQQHLQQHQHLQHQQHQQHQQQHQQPQRLVEARAGRNGGESPIWLLMKLAFGVWLLSRGGNSTRMFVLAVLAGLMFLSQIGVLPAVSPDGVAKMLVKPGEHRQSVLQEISNLVVAFLWSLSPGWTLGKLDELRAPAAERNPQQEGQQQQQELQQPPADVHQGVEQRAGEDIEGVAAPVENQ